MHSSAGSSSCQPVLGLHTPSASNQGVEEDANWEREGKNQ